MIPKLELAKLVREHGQFAMKQIDGGHRSEAAWLDVLAYAKQMESANARHVLHHIESICSVCGHTNTEDGCANCIKRQIEIENAELRKDKERLDWLLHGFLISIETMDGCLFPNTRAAIDFVMKGEK